MGTANLQLLAGEEAVRVEVGRGSTVYPLSVDEPQVHAIVAHVLDRISRDLFVGRLVVKEV